MVQWTRRNATDVEILVRFQIGVQSGAHHVASIVLPCYNGGMKKFRYDVSLVVEVEAFDEIDAEEAVRDAFGLGDMCGVMVVESEVGGFRID